jgi:hypothetical protein
MSVLGDQAAGDLQAPFDDWADSVTFTAPTGSPPAVIGPLQGLVFRTNARRDLQTGQMIIGEAASVTLKLADILAAAPADGWKVDGTDRTGAFVAYVDSDLLPDKTLGIVTVMLRQ